jgi:hypothetical protein
MRSETRIHSELPLCFGSLLVANLILYSLDAGQSLNLDTINRTQVLVWIKHSSRYTELQAQLLQGVPPTKMAIEFLFNFCYTAEEVLWTRGQPLQDMAMGCIGIFQVIEKLRLTDAGR